jgi:hypothetical protein
MPRSSTDTTWSAGWPSPNNVMQRRAAMDTARSELRELASRKEVSEQKLKEARARLEAVAARAKRLRDLMDKLEERLDL